ncbi:PREDICTED: spindle assembly checkpoint component MAD1 isoform X1 [Tarenaya hassleriana]|uniref:spindle assembly checkpoint component MAD1 isoform X1 n=1 Tax=Tarenaya hassleriana TaxID=28532 RepID=UPI00053C1D19|nr:PREDICTED: spindle assembly checkpoint component MAD1 isoform X1 [Tarenaya hassleriana]
MAGMDTQKQLLSLIRDFTSEKSRGEQRVVGLKKRIENLRSDLEAANTRLEDAKRNKETSEQELNGYEVELALNESTIQSLEARIALVQEEISAVSKEVDALKNEESLLRDQFISQMFGLNNEIRKFQKAVTSIFERDDGTDLTTGIKVFQDGCRTASRTVEDMLADINSQLEKEEEEYLAEQHIQKELQMVLDDYEKKFSLMEAITEKTKSLQDLTRYPELH